MANKRHCGGYIEPQFGRTMTCSVNDIQCDSCQLLDINDEVDRLTRLVADLEQEVADCEADIATLIDYNIELQQAQEKSK